MVRVMKERVQASVDAHKEETRMQTEGGQLAMVTPKVAADILRHHLALLADVSRFYLSRGESPFLR